MTAKDGKRARPDTIQTVGKAFNIVEAVQELESPTLSEIASQVDLPKSTVHIYLRTLVAEEYLVERDGHYRIGLRFLKHGGFARRQLPIYQAAKEQVNKLAAQTGEAANLGVEEYGKRVLIYKVEEGAAVYDNAPTGEQVHMHLTALGKAILAHLPEYRVDEIVERHGLPVATEQTITDRNRLDEELATIRERGYSIEDEERRPGIMAVGAPIMDQEQDTIAGAICLSGPKTRIQERMEGDIVDDIINAANVIELRYNHY
jgi:IclR family acetate operon transcriptional repressor